MQIQIRNYIKNNFKGLNENEIKESITSAINEGDEVSLPGLGVLFEILWENSNSNLQNSILTNLKNNLH